MSIKLVNSMYMLYRQTLNKSYSLKGVAFDNHILIRALLSFLVLQLSGRGRERWLLYFNCLPDALRLFLMVLWVVLQYVIVVFSDHTYTLR